MKFVFYAPQMAAYGGIEEHVCNLAVAVSRRGDDVIVLTTSNSLGADLRSKLASADSIELRELPLGRGRASRWMKLLWILWQSLRIRRGGVDLVYTNGQSALSRQVWRAARKGARIIHHHHNSVDEAERASWTASYKRVLSEAPELVACSDITRKEINEAFGRKDTMFIPCITENVCGPPRERCEHDGGRLKFGFLGRLVPTKGIDVIMQLAKDSELSHIQWAIHGEGKDYPRSVFGELQRITYCGPYHGISDTERILGELDAVCLFSKHSEGLPLVLIEAMSGGVPWIATDRGGTRELARDGADAIVLRRDFDYESAKSAVLDMTARIRSGLTNRHRQRAIFEKRFSPAVVSEKWMQYFG